MTAVLGASMLAVGVGQGIAEGDRVDRQAVLGRAVGSRRAQETPWWSSATRSRSVEALFPLAGSVPLVLVARFMDRVGKGIRGAPRDALIADVTPAEVRGAAYDCGRRSTPSAQCSAARGHRLMLLLASRHRAVLWVAVVPAILSVVVLVLFVREPPATSTGPCESSVAHGAG